MTARITHHQAEEIQRLKALGRTPRQIEQQVGLTYGLLSKPFVVGDDARPIMDRDPGGGGWRYPKAEGDA